MKFLRVGLLVVAMSLFSVVLNAQAEAPVVRILPVDAAQFIPGALFDIRVEVEAAELPEDFAVTVNGTPAGEFFGVERTDDTWEYGGRVAAVVSEGTPGDDFTIDSLVGDYYNPTFGVANIAVADGALSVTVAGETVSGAPVEDNPLAFVITGGAADGATAEFGLNADGGVTGFTVLGQPFGVLTSLPTKVVAPTWRDVTAPEVGEYVVEVTAGGETTSATWTVREVASSGARNVILFVADGMSVPTLSAARVVRGMTQGRADNPLFIDGFRYVGLASTSSIDSVMADSANTASALNTGHIGSVNATGTYSDTSPDRLDDPQVETLAEMLKRTRGYSIGVVTTADFSDATSAAAFAHGRDRADANRNAYVVQALEFGVDVLMGGGARRLIPQSVEGSRRTDDRDLFAEFEAAGYTVVTNNTELSASVEGDAPALLLGVFHPNDMNTWLDRNVYTENLGEFTDQPGLSEMTLGALEVLSTNENGFYLTVEAASVDKQLHPLDQERALSDLIEFDQTIGDTIAWLEANGLAENTLIVVTADHGHGYEVYGTVNTEVFDAGTTDLERRRAIRVYNAAGYPDYPDADGDGQPEWADATIVLAGNVNNGPDHTEDFRVSPVPRVPAISEDGVFVDNPDDDPNGIFISGTLDPASSTGVHTLQDVPVFAMGPGAEGFLGMYHQREIFFGMASALGLNPAVESAE